jgi:hypothetical protein
VMDHFSVEALDTYLSRFDQAFRDNGDDYQIRAFFNDSYEVYGSDWTPDFVAQFLARRGYDITDYLEALHGEGDPEGVARVKADYRLTVSELLLEVTNRWKNWAHQRQALARNQAHGSPGNLIDLYAAVDIPETEIFRYSQFELPGLDYPHLPEGMDAPNYFVMKFASSAANLMGRPLVSSESFTWLRDHFQTALFHAKPEVDKLFTAGINHLFYHGSTYSPREEAWPGWLFYASSHLNPTNAWWKDLKNFNQYVASCQSLLQASKPDNDILLYWPVSDLWSGVYPELDPQPFSTFTMHNPDKWLYPTSFYKTAEYLASRGYTFDYISDAILQRIEMGKEDLVVAGSRYKAIVVPSCTYMPFATLHQLAQLEKSGATVIFMDRLPERVPGLASHWEFGHRFQVLLQRQPFKHITPLSDPGKLEQVLAGREVRREAMGQHGLRFLRKKNPEGHLYFITNLSATPVDAWLPVAVPATGSLLLDPMHGKSGVAAVRRNGQGQQEVWLQLQPGESRILRTSASSFAAPPWKYYQAAGQPVALQGEWQLKFLEGGPELPQETTLRDLVSWTETGDPQARHFSGTAVYTLTFDRPEQQAEGYLLQFDQIAASAQVWVNGAYAGALVALPWQLDLGGKLKKKKNTLRIEVTNLDANRIIHLDQTDPSWKKFTDINIVDINYKPFDASKNEPLPSGLIGQVRLVPVKYRKER